MTRMDCVLMNHNHLLYSTFQLSKLYCLKGRKKEALKNYTIYSPKNKLHHQVHTSPKPAGTRL